MTETETERRVFRTTDLAFAAYLKMRGLRLLTTEKDQDGRTVFVLDDSKDLSGQLRMEFSNSECCRFDSELRHLKKLIFR